MKIEGNTIIFKSTPENFFKEKAGLKSNTQRRLTLWSEMKAFEDFYNDCKYMPAVFYKIKIINTLTHEEFIRTITDICEFDGIWTISWRGE